MIEQYYSNIQFLAWILLILLGSYLIFGNMPGKVACNSYNRSRKIMGCAFFIYAIQFFLQWKFHLRDSLPQVASALNITVFYVGSILFNMSFISLLDNKYITKKRTVTDLTLWAMTTCAIAIALFYANQPLQSAVLAVGAMMFLVYEFMGFYIFFRAYYRTVKKMQNYYSDDQDCVIRWMSKSIFYAISLGLLCSFMAFAVKWMITIYLIAGILMFFYIFVSFINYLIHSEQVEQVVSEEPCLESDTEISMEKTCTIKRTKVEMSASDLQIERFLQEWLAAKGYCTPSITIEQLAKQMKTNRNYLSNYINTHFSCTFRQWILDLRIKDAKEILLDQSDMTIIQIATNVGFASDTHFRRVFTEMNGMPPKNWRQANRKG